MKIKLEHSEPLAIGAYAEATGSGAVAIGDYAVAQQSSIQLGAGTNIDPNTLKFKNTTLVNANGKVPTANLDKAVVLRTNGVAPDAEGNVKVSQLISSNGDGKASIDNNGNLNLVGEYTSGRIVIDVPEGEVFKVYPYAGHSGVAFTGKTYIDNTEHPWKGQSFQSVGGTASSPGSGSIGFFKYDGDSCGTVAYECDNELFTLSYIHSWNPELSVNPERYCGMLPSIYREKVFLPSKKVDTVHNETQLKSSDGYVSIMASDYPNGATVKQTTGKSFTVKFPSNFSLWRPDEPGATTFTKVYSTNGNVISITFTGPYHDSSSGNNYWLPQGQTSINSIYDGWSLFSWGSDLPDILMFKTEEGFSIRGRGPGSFELIPEFNTFTGYLDGDRPTITSAATETSYIATSKIKLRDPYIVTSQSDRLFISDIAGGSGVQFSAMAGTSYDTIELQGDTIKLVGHSGSTSIDASIGENGFSAYIFNLYQTPEGGTTPPTVIMHKFGDALGTHTTDGSFTLAVSSGVVKDSAGGSGYVVYAIPK